jgi:hypothetical protein
MKWYIPIIISVILSSCSAQWHLSKAVKKDPQILQKDTVIAVDTIVTPPVALTDTVVLKETDTIVVEKERLKVKISRRFDTIRVDATCESDTIISIVEVPVDKVIYKERETPIQKLQKFALFFLGAIVLWRVIEERLIKR